MLFKVAKSLVTSSLLISFFFAGCGNDGSSSSSSGEKDVTAEFFSKYGRGVETASDRFGFRMTDDGRLQYRITDNDVCELLFDGQIESVTIVEEFYAVKYRYSAVENTRASVTCSVSDTFCQLDKDDCTRSIQDSQSRLGQAGTKFVSADTETSEVVFIP